VVLAGTRRPTGAHLGHVNLLHRLEAAGCVRGQQAREPGREAGADDDVQAALDRLSVEGQKVPRVVDVVGDRHHGGAGVEGGLGVLPVPPRAGEQDDVGVGRAGDGPGRLTERRHHGLESGLARLHDAEFVDFSEEQQLAGGAHADRSRPDHHGAHDYFSSGPLSSRHPPCCNGTGPPRLNRTPAAAMPASTRAKAPRRSALTGAGPAVGLAGIEPATSPLSGVRSNRLSYSPGVCAGHRLSPPANAMEHGASTAHPHAVLRVAREAALQHTCARSRGCRCIEGRSCARMRRSQSSVGSERPSTALKQHTPGGALAPTRHLVLGLQRPVAPAWLDQLPAEWVLSLGRYAVMAARAIHRPFPRVGVLPLSSCDAMGTRPISSLRAISAVWTKAHPVGQCARSAPDKEKPHLALPSS
jgi:hypothetical protein